jgi:hypothetical protein
VRKSIGTKRTASGAWIGRSKSASRANGRRYPYFVLCIDNRGYLASLQVGKVYQVLKPIDGDLPSDLRLVDEDGEDYLYSPERFVAIDLPPRAKRAVAEAAIHN